MSFELHPPINEVGRLSWWVIILVRVTSVLPHLAEAPAKSASSMRRPRLRGLIDAVGNQVVTLGGDAQVFSDPGWCAPERKHSSSICSMRLGGGSSFIGTTEWLARCVTSSLTHFAVNANGTRDVPPRCRQSRPAAGLIFSASRTFSRLGLSAAAPRRRPARECQVP